MNLNFRERGHLPPLNLRSFFAQKTKPIGGISIAVNEEYNSYLKSKFDGFVKSPSAALRFNPALLDKRLRILE